MFISTTSPLVFSMYSYKFVLNLFICYYISFLPARVVAGSVESICASDWFVRMEKVTTAHTILTIISGEILRTVEAEILKILKNIQPQAQN